MWILMNFVCSRHASIAPDDDFKCHAVKLNRIAMGATDRPQSGQIISKVAIGRFDYWEIPTDNCVYLTYRHIKKHDNQNNDLIRLEINGFILVENCLFLFSFASSAKYIFMVSIINHIVYYGIFFFIFFLMTHLLHDGFDQTRRCHTYWKSKFNKLSKQWTKLVLFAVDWFQNIKMYDYYGTKYSSSCYELKNPPTKCDIKMYIDNFAPENKKSISPYNLLILEILRQFKEP